MVPVKAIFMLERESVGEIASRRNGELCNAWHTVHLRRPSLEDTMPMDGGFYCQVVLNEDFKVIPFFSFDKRTGLLVVDEIHLPRNSIRCSDAAVNGEIIRAQPCARTLAERDQKK